MITNDEMKRFLEWKEDAEKPVLSVYLKIEAGWENSIHRSFETEFREMVHQLEAEIGPAAAGALRENEERIATILKKYEPVAKTLVFFSCAGAGYLWMKELKIPIDSRVRFGAKPYLLPLLEAFDEFERYGVVLADKEKARIFTYCLGEIEEERASLATNEVRQIRTSGKDNLRSAFKLQRTAEMHTEWHLKHVVELLRDLAEANHFERLILSGSNGTVTELESMLPFELQHKVVKRLSLPVNTSEKHLSTALIEAEQEIERAEELKLVKEFLCMAPTNTTRAIGEDAVLVHLNKGLIYRLFYSENYKSLGRKCTSCGYLYSAGHRTCGRCSVPLQTVPDLMEEIARKTISTGGRIEEVKGEAAQELDRFCEIGAWLKRENS